MAGWMEMLHQVVRRLQKVSSLSMLEVSLTGVLEILLGISIRYPVLVVLWIKPKRFMSLVLLTTLRHARLLLSTVLWLQTLHRPFLILQVLTLKQEHQEITGMVSQVSTTSTW